MLGIVGANGMGKSTFAKLLAGAETPTTGTMETSLRISYKPQYIKADTSDSVEMYSPAVYHRFDTSMYQHEIIEALNLQPILQSPVDTLSGGELQRTAIAGCLSRDADVYILDEPSAHLDVEQRVKVTRMIKHHAEGKEVGIMVIDHDIYLIDMISERILVFDGEPGISGTATGPFRMRDGMNRFLNELDVTFRRDQSGRPGSTNPDHSLTGNRKAWANSIIMHRMRNDLRLSYILIFKHAIVTICGRRSFRTPLSTIICTSYRKIFMGISNAIPPKWMPTFPSFTGM